jgi:nitroimidazol reductase NimA-like FMN-containing flavoprotein (pyridoxamine 5'-phosphate oxidase superfamily)
MRRQDREIRNRAEIDEVIRVAEVCRIAFAVENEPYVVPLSFGYDGRRLYFHTAEMGKKIECIKANPRVCFEMERGVRLVEHPRKACSWSFAFESVIGYGTLCELLTPEDKERALSHIMEHYSDRTWDFDPAEMTGVRVWSLAVETVSGKRSTVKERPKGSARPTP